MRAYLYVLSALATLAVLTPGNARAETVYKWCAYYGNFDNAATNCGFSTRQQCLATVSGIGGYCDINPRWTGDSRSKRSRN
jgi:hypothetical protein